jgi:hypothetical protein
VFEYPRDAGSDLGKRIEEGVPASIIGVRHPAAALA